MSKTQTTFLDNLIFLIVIYRKKKMYINVELSMLIKYSLLFFSSYLCMYVPLIVISYIEDTCKMLCYDFPLFYVLSLI